MNNSHCQSSWIQSGLLLLCLLSLVQCKKQKKVSDEFNPAFTEKIAAFTSGAISSESTIRIILTEDNPKAGEQPNSPADNDLFKFKPSIEGTTVWLDKRTLEFRPSEKLQSGQQYRARFQLGDLVEVEKSLSIFEFDFSVVEQDWTVTPEGYQTHNENDLVWNRIKGSVSTADVIDIEKIKEYFSAKQNQRKLKMNWETEDRRNFIFSVDSVKREEKEGKAEIVWDGSPEFDKLKGSVEIKIPSLSDYKVLDVKIVHQPDQYIEIMFSDPIKKNQTLDGFIYLDNNTSLEYSVAGNIVKAFPVARQNGETKLTVREGLMNILGYQLKETYTTTITFEVPKPAVRITGKGVILPSSKGMVFPFEAVNLNAVDVKIIRIFENNIGHFLQVNKLDGSYELKRAGRMVHRETIVLGNEPANLTKWNRFYLDLAKLIEPDQGSIYRIEISFRKKYSLYPCEGSSEDEEEATVEDEDDIQQEISYWDSYENYYDEYYDYDYDYDWEERDDPCSKSYYTQSKYVARNILASDLGIIVKAGTDQNMFCAVTSLVTAEAMDGVEVTLYNYQQQRIASGITDNSGFVNIPVKEKPFLLIARKDKQRGYLRIDDGSAISLGAFDVSGKTVPKGLKAFIYGERGVWRPGDTIFISCILEDKQKLLPMNHPVIFELLNPKGQLYAKTTRTSGQNGFYTWAVSTGTDALTGNYSLRVKAGGTLFDKTLKVESIKPNRLKINISFNATRLSSTKNDVNGNLGVTWLHGATGADLRAVITVKMSDAPTTFSKYPEYTFIDPAKRFESEEQTIFDGNTNANGEAYIPGKFSVNNDAPGMLQANFTTRVFEKSGEFSIDHFSMPYSPYSAYIGLRTPHGDKRGMLLTDTTQWVDVVLLNEDGQPISRTDAEAYVYKLNWRNWWESADDQLANYLGSNYNQPLVSSKFQVKQGKGRFSFRINRPEWGRFYVRVIDPVSGHSAGKEVYIDWPGWAGSPLRNNPEAASILTFTSDKQKYQAGETAEIVVPAGKGGNALITVESGSRILSREWVKAEGKELRHKLSITPEMTPNVYVHVTLIQPHASSENDMPMRLYGVIPIFVEDPQTILNPVIKVPESLEPLQKYHIQVSEQNNREMTYTLAVVEEGLLDLTRFKTPDAWSVFYAREALGVRTWDLYDMVIGAFGGKIASVLGIGGDDNAINNESAEKANRFKPVVKFIGPFALKAGKTNNHSLQMPNYIGSVRVMVVAGQDGAYGLAEKAVKVKKPLMVLATLPRVLGPGEIVKLPVTVFAMDPAIKNVNVSFKTNSLILAGGETSQNIEFTKTGEKVIEFDLRISTKTGIGKVQVIASSGKNISEYSLEIDVRAANPPVTTFVGSTVEAGKKEVISYELPGMPGSNSAMLEVSAIPPIDAERRMKYLIRYPHGCIEQTTSTAFAQLYLPDIVELDDKMKNTIDANIKSGINRIRSFQISGGAFSYWPGENYYNSWGSSYAGHFLLEAEKKGYAVPSSVKSAWLKSQKQLAIQWTPKQVKDPYNQDDLEQAYRLYTLALAGEAEMTAMNRLRETKNLSVQAKWRLAAAYALSGQATIAKELISRETIEIQSYTGFYSSYGSRERDMAMLLETLTILNDKIKGSVLVKKISESLSSSMWMSTQTTAYSLMAVAKFSKGSTSGKIEFSYRAGNGKTLTASSGKPILQIPLPVEHNDKTGSLTITNNSGGVLFTKIIMEGIPVAGEEKEYQNNLTLDVDYLSTDGNTIDVSEITQGTDFVAVVSVYNPGAYRYTNLALTQIFPPGWEISNTRLADNALSHETNVPTYQDIRDDRIYTYFDLNRNEKKTFVVKLNASYLGRYYLTGAYCEAMYDNSIAAMKKGQWVEVKKAGE